MKKSAHSAWDSTIVAEEFLSVTQPSQGQLTNLTKELSSSHGEREASRVQPRHDRQARAVKPAGLAKDTLTEKLVKWRGRIRNLQLPLKNQSEKLTRDGANSKFCLKSYLNNADKLELRKQI